MILVLKRCGFIVVLVGFPRLFQWVLVILPAEGFFQKKLFLAKAVEHGLLNKWHFSDIKLLALQML